jgi:hypothetical protein
MIKTTDNASDLFAKMRDAFAVVFPVREYTRFERVLLWIENAANNIAFAISAPLIAFAVGFYRGIERAVDMFMESEK